MKKNYIKYNKLKSAWHFLKPHKSPITGLVILFGQRGTGKSTDIAHRYHTEYKKWIRNKSNYVYFYTNLKIPNADKRFYRYLDLNNYSFTDYINPYIGDYKNISTYNKCKDKPPFCIDRNGYVCIDELGILAHSRDYKNFPKEFTNFVKLVRHFGIYLVCYSQAYDIDKTLRTGANDLYLMRKIFDFTFSLKLKKQIVVNTDQSNNQSADSQIMDKVKFCSPFLPSSWRVTYIPFYTDYFNSYE